MNAFLLGDASDEIIADELPKQLKRNDEAFTGDEKSGKLLISDGTAGTVADWFVNGGTRTTKLGNMPEGFGNNDQGYYAAQQSLLTGWTCARCHENSAMGNIVWGQTYSRETVPDSGIMSNITGHSSAPGAESANSAYTSPNCSPCHSGSLPGGYRYLGFGSPYIVGVPFDNEYTVTKDNDPKGIHSARAFGCDQCHDAIGKATNSTAFPHGNHGITVWEWTGGKAAGKITNPLVAGGGGTFGRTEKAIGAYGTAPGNLWMYASNIAAIESTTTMGVPVTDYLNGSTWGKAAEAGASGTVGSPGGADVRLVDPNFTLLEGTVQDGATIGKIQDTVCLKCHVPVDVDSAKAAADAGHASGELVATGVERYYLNSSGSHHNDWPSVIYNPTSDTWVGTFAWENVNPYNGFDTIHPGSKGPGGYNTTGVWSGNRLLYIWR
jgi:cytochrome c553